MKNKRRNFSIVEADILNIMWLKGCKNLENVIFRWQGSLLWTEFILYINRRKIIIGIVLFTLVFVCSAAYLYYAMFGDMVLIQESKNSVVPIGFVNAKVLSAIPNKATHAGSVYRVRAYVFPLGAGSVAHLLEYGYRYTDSLESGRDEFLVIEYQDRAAFNENMQDTARHNEAVQLPSSLRFLKNASGYYSRSDEGSRVEVYAPGGIFTRPLYISISGSANDSAQVLMQRIVQRVSKRW